MSASRVSSNEREKTANPLAASTRTRYSDGSKEPRLVLAQTGIQCAAVKLPEM
jgi:hypothetical protein